MILKKINWWIFSKHHIGWWEDYWCMKDLYEEVISIITYVICSWWIYRKTMTPQSLLSGLHLIISPFVIWYKYHRINRITVAYSTVQKEVDTRFSILLRIENRVENWFSIVAPRFSIPARLINQNGLFKRVFVSSNLLSILRAILNCCKNPQPLFKFWASSNFFYVKKVFLLPKI